MTESQELSLVDGTSGSYVGNLPAISALCIPALHLQDGPQGVGDGFTGVTQLPAPVAATSTWDTSLEQQYGAVVGSEQAGKGTNVDLGPPSTSCGTPVGAGLSNRWGRTLT